MRRLAGILLVIASTAYHTIICEKIGYDIATWQGIALYASAVGMMIGGMLGSYPVGDDLSEEE